MEKIGDFAKRCEVTVQTLRWYDKLGLLVPDYIDKFTGYRYYSEEKAAEVQRITALKDIGFSLEEIKRFCSAKKDDEKYQFIWQKRQELEKLSKETAQKLRILTKIEENLNTDKKGAHKMKNKEKDNFDIEFENDETVIGRWEVIGAVDKKEDYTPGKKIFRRGIFFSELYFLPNGEEYWRFSWTKNRIKMAWNDGFRFLTYETKEINGELYMFIRDFEQTIILKQTDKKRYTKNEIGQRGDISLIDKPFVNDEKVLGKWSSIGYVKDEINNFNPTEQNNKVTVNYKSAEFMPGGEFFCVMDKSADYTPSSEMRWFMDGSFKSKWTKGMTFYNTSYGLIANKYEIRDIDGKEYLFIEWKTNDYVYAIYQYEYKTIWKLIYYVFVRDV